MNVKGMPSYAKMQSALHSDQVRACLTMYEPNHNTSDGHSPDDDPMSQSMHSLHAITPVFRGRRRHVELTPALPRERIYAVSAGHPRETHSRPGTADSGSSLRQTPKRAVSMTRLDQLAQPRRRYVEETLKSKTSLNICHSSSLSLSPTRPIVSMSSSMDSAEVKRRVKPAGGRKPRPLSVGSPYLIKSNVEDKPREARALDKQSAQPTPRLRSNRGRSSGGPLRPRPQSLISPDSDGPSSSPKPTPPLKPAHVKAAAMARKATKQCESIEPKDVKVVKEVKVDKEVKDVAVKEVTVDKESGSEDVATSVPSLEPKVDETPVNGVNSDISNSYNNNSKKEVSEEDYKKMMAEKRRLAREQAEREAEAERLRIERERQEEEERIRREEEEQRKFEEEQLRLIEMQKRAEEERLKKAMEENRLREEEENRRKAEELRLRLEKEEKEKRAKEEAERQRMELEERLKRDEEERLQRKKKLEAIMSRTRKTVPTTGDQSPSDSPNETPEPRQTENNNTNGSTADMNRTKNSMNSQLAINDAWSDSQINNNGNFDIALIGP